MSFVITAPCVGDFSCVEVCPVHCISPGPEEADFDGAEQMYINPEVCINCGICVEVCPVLAIYEAATLPEKYRHYEDINREYFRHRDKNL
ncbi:MAG: indolepyruvate ferredoxin oxidoreductase subunit alpha [Parahaliea sp.]